MKIALQFLYNYCTDFMINLANLTGTSYYETNLIILCILLPLGMLFLITLNVFQYIRYYKKQ